MSMANTDGLSLDQAPPLSIPSSFFITAPVAILSLGLLLLTGENLFISPLHLHTVALAHLGTLGILCMVMFGAMVQMLPVVAGSPVPFARMAHVVHGALTFGLALLVIGFLVSSPLSLTLGGGAIGLSFMLFIAGAGVSLVRAPTKDTTVLGMGVAVLSLTVMGAFGLYMVSFHAGGAFSGSRVAWMQTHLTLGLLGWVGTLIGAVSLKVVPMFYLAQALPERLTRYALAAIIVGLFATVIAFGLGVGPLGMALATAPAALVVWFAHPISILMALKDRRRKRSDISIRFWQTGLSMSLCCIPLALVGLLTEHQPLAILFGWVAIWGWASMILHGMLYRIVPFLVWFHRLSRFVGVVPVPPMRRILPEGLARRAYWAHVSSLGLGVIAILSGSVFAARATGVATVLVAIFLGHALHTAYGVKSPKVEVST